MDSRERLEALESVLFWAGVRTADRPVIASMILASDWLRDTLAAERERCAKVASDRDNIWPNATDTARGESAGWRDIASAPKDGDWILLRGRNAAGFPMIPVVCSWRRHSAGHTCWVDAVSHRDLTTLVSDVPPGTAADWHPLPGTQPAPETADERQAAIVAALRGKGFELCADWIESGEWRR